MIVWIFDRILKDKQFCGDTMIPESSIREWKNEIVKIVESGRSRNPRMCN